VSCNILSEWIRLHKNFVLLNFSNNLNWGPITFSSGANFVKSETGSWVWVCV
jgi:hypothetical protein